MPPELKIAAGAMCNNQRHGQGTYRWADGCTYEGEYSCNLRNGEQVPAKVTNVICFQAKDVSGLIPFSTMGPGKMI
eukprot:764151-Hanusia_phi.AAC.8